MANNTGYSPYGELVTLREAMGRLFEDSFVSPLTWRQFDGEMLNPAIDQTADELIVTTSLPCLKAEDVDINVKVKPTIKP